MEYVLTPFSRAMPPFAYWDNAFSNEELDYLQSLAREKNETARVGNGQNGESNLNIRRSSVRWVPNTPDHTWIFAKLAHVVSSINADFYNFDLTGFGEAIQLTNYSEKDNGMYGWHVDFGGGSSPSRKLSVTVQLSDPVEYEGGYLELKPNNDEVIRPNKKRGLITIFPSWTLHQVTPVTAGLRQSLVLWTTGPMFK